MTQRRRVRPAKGVRKTAKRAEHVLGTWNRIIATDLQPVRDELVRREIFYPADVERAIEEYRRFLLLQSFTLRADGDGCAAFVPPDEISEVWHAHILDLRRYLGDCDRIFGRTLYHGYAPAPDTPAYADGIAQFRRLYAERFGDAPGRFTFTSDHMDEDNYATVYEEIGGECVRVR